MTNFMSKPVRHETFPQIPIHSPIIYQFIVSYLKHFYGFNLKFLSKIFFRVFSLKQIMVSICMLSALFNSGPL